MPSPKVNRSRHKLSFAVDRSEIDISSDWVQAVMQPPPAAPKSFSVPETENATVEIAATVETRATVEDNPTVVNNATVAENTTGALFGEIYTATVEQNATVANNSTDIQGPGAVSGAKRSLRLRPIHRITDGLTPGQYSVYRLMFEKGESSSAGEHRLFRGGYVDLVRLTGLSKRGIQNVIAELQEKCVISLYKAPGYHRSQASVYGVPSEQSVLERWFAQGWRYSAGKSKKLLNITTVA